MYNTTNVSSPCYRYIVGDINKTDSLFTNVTGKQNLHRMNRNLR